MPAVVSRSIASEWFSYAVASPGTKDTSVGDEVLHIGLLGVFSIRAGDSVIADEAWRLRRRAAGSTGRSGISSCAAATQAWPTAMRWSAGRESPRGAR